MIDLNEKLEVIVLHARKSDAPFIEAAIARIRELEAKLAHYEEDISDWQSSVETQMGRRRDDK